MRRFPWQRPMVIWAARDLLRHPTVSLVLFGALTGLITLTALVFLLNRTMTTATNRLLAQTPDVVVRRVNNGGWVPLPAEAAVMQAGSVAGVLNPRARVWGVVQGPHQPITVVGAEPGDGMRLPQRLTFPNPGECLAGPGVMVGQTTPLQLYGDERLSFTISGRLPDTSSMATHDVVVLHVADARRLLGLGPDQASDLALDVFHDDEAEALLPDLVAAFPWPVQVTTRYEQTMRHLNFLSQRTGAAWLALIPALLAMICLVGVVALLGAQRKENGLLKAMGWTSGQILHLHVLKGGMVCAPAIGAGVALAYGLMFMPGMRWVARLLFGWREAPPAVYLSSQGAAGALLLATLMVALPFMVAVFWTGWRAASVAAADALVGEA